MPGEMAAELEFFGAISKSYDNLANFSNITWNIINSTAQQTIKQQLVSCLLAITQAGTLTHSLARSHELAMSIKGNWTNANAADRLMAISHLASGLSKSKIPQLMSDLIRYAKQGHLEADFWRLWGSSSLEGKVRVIVGSGYGIFYAYRRFKQDRERRRRDRERRRGDRERRRRDRERRRRDRERRRRAQEEQQQPENP